MARLTFTNLINYLTETFGDELNARFNALKTVGNLAIIYQGAYDAGTAYKTNDAVDDGGSMWLAIADSTGVTPTEGASWHLIGGSSGSNGSVLAFDVTGLSSITVTNNQSGRRSFRLYGVLSNDFDLIVPAFVTQWFITNDTSGAHDVTVKTAAGTGEIVAQGSHRFLATDGTNVIPAISVDDIPALPTSKITAFTEAVQDAVGAFIAAGAGMGITYDDVANTLTFVVSNPLTNEAVQDIVGAMAVSGTNATATYDDVAGTLTISATGDGTGLTQEQVEDIVAALLVQGTNVTLSYNDGTGQLTITAAGSSSLDINGLTEETAIADGDFLPIYDVSASANRKMTKANLVAGLSGASLNSDLLIFMQHYR